jgi:nucleoprotein TPR
VQLVDLQAHVDASKIEITALKDDNQRWRGRAQQILAKYERIDPAEHELLKNQVLTLGAAQTQLEADVLLAQKEIEVLKDGKQKGQKLISSLRAALAEKEASLSHMSDKSTSDGILAEKETEIEAWKSKNKDLIVRSNANTQKHFGERKRLRAQILTLEESIVCAPM